MYRFLLSPRWLGIAALALAAAAGMGLLGFWQLERFHTRGEINDRVAAAVAAPPAPLADFPSSPATTDEWRRVTVTGEYDPANLILVRGRTSGTKVGFEVLVPLRVPTGPAVIIDLGWVPPGPSGLSERPSIPNIPQGQVTVAGRIRLPESSPGPVDRSPSGDLEVRRIHPDRIAGKLPYPIRNGWVSADPPAEGFQPIGAEPGSQPTWMNIAYVIQWWLFAGMVVFGYVWFARKEANPATPAKPHTPASSGT
ncbi:SURF1 family protein [Longispora albida]|uniref:SURF1 family cytochrome oxidase biogenesis protein n=1 Tax=Longispora albida TaxID=203523 RepID=UPI0012FAD24E|nr:SURF1 family protein [Longispora albida]